MKQLKEIEQSLRKTADEIWAIGKSLLTTNKPRGDRLKILSGAIHIECANLLEAPHLWCVELHNKADGPDWTWVGIADSAEEATNKAFAHCGGADFFDVGEVDMTQNS